MLRKDHADLRNSKLALVQAVEDKLERSCAFTPGQELLGLEDIPNQPVLTAITPEIDEMKTVCGASEKRRP